NLPAKMDIWVHRVIHPKIVCPPSIISILRRSARCRDLGLLVQLYRTARCDLIGDGEIRSPPRVASETHVPRDLVPAERVSDCRQYGSRIPTPAKVAYHRDTGGEESLSSAYQF